MKYSQHSKRAFLNTLADYRGALESGNPQAIVATSLQIHVAAGLVPIKMRRYVGHVWKEVTQRKATA